VLLDLLNLSSNNRQDCLVVQALQLDCLDRNHNSNSKRLDLGLLSLRGLLSGPLSLRPRVLELHKRRELVSGLVHPVCYSFSFFLFIINDIFIRTCGYRCVWCAAIDRWFWHGHCNFHRFVWCSSSCGHPFWCSSANNDCPGFWRWIWANSTTRNDWHWIVWRG
jgi:hypothetical protein